MRDPQAQAREPSFKQLMSRMDAVAIEIERARSRAHRLFWVGVICGAVGSVIGRAVGL